MGLFVYTQKGSIISMVDLPTTEIIEPFALEEQNWKKWQSGAIQLLMGQSIQVLEIMVQ